MTPIRIIPIPVTLATLIYSSLSGFLETFNTLWHCLIKFAIDSLFRFIKIPLHIVINRRRNKNLDIIKIGYALRAYKPLHGEDRTD